MKIKSVILELLIKISHEIKGYYYTYYYYPRVNKKCNKTAVAVIDGLLYTGGMTDRFIGIISLYAWSKINNVPFYIQYTYPFNITDYLQPNLYNWIPGDGDYIKSSINSQIVYAVGETNVETRLNWFKNKKQIHFYGNRDFLETKDYNKFNWGILFKELFKPSKYLHDKIIQLKTDIGRDYFSIVFRFQNLLGDFEEYNFKSLSNTKDKNRYINKCLNVIQQLQEEMKAPCLVTSDSVMFLNMAIKIPNVHIISGSLVHMGSNATGSYEQYEKSFLDFYMLSDSFMIFNVVYDKMYPSGFPLYASKINSVPFKRIILK